jgi:hypothetical protein
MLQSDTARKAQAFGIGPVTTSLANLMWCSHRPEIPTQEALAPVALLRADFPDPKVRYINVVDLFKLQPSTERPHGLPD